MLLLIVGSISGGIWLYRSDAFRVQQVTVTGTEALNPHDLRQQVNLQDQSMFTVSTADAARRLASLPLVRDVSVTRSWPQTIVIEIVERKPVVFWKIGNASYPVDEEGVVVTGAVPPWGAPTIQYQGPATSLKPGDRVDADAVRLALRLLEVVPQVIGDNPFSFQYSPSDGLTLSTESGYLVTLGDSRDLDWKLAVWTAMLDYAREARKEVNHLDLRFGINPALR